MNSSVFFLSVSVLVQVVAFQFASIRLGRAMADAMVGPAGLPEEISAQVASFRRRAGRTRGLLGIVLGLGVIATAVLLPLDDHARKIGLAVVSLVCSGLLVSAYVHDYQKLLALSRLLPQPAVRAASLARRSLAGFYPPLWEALPAGIFLATVVFTVWFARRGAESAGFPFGGAVPAAPVHLADLRLWIQPIIGAVLLSALLALSLHRAVVRSCVTPQSRAFYASPEAAAEYEGGLRRLEMRHGLFSRIGIALLLAVIQFRTVTSARGGEPGSWSNVVLLLLLVTLLSAFVLYSVQLGRMKQR